MSQPSPLVASAAAPRQQAQSGSCFGGVHSVGVTQEIRKRHAGGYELFAPPQRVRARDPDLPEWQARVESKTSAPPAISSRGEIRR